MSRLFFLSGASRSDPAVADWFASDEEPLRRTAKAWFDRVHACDPAVRELMHDGHPTACVADAAFAYVDAFAAHAAIGFFHGAELDDPAGLLEGGGRHMRHVKLRPSRPVDAAALEALVEAAYRDIRARLTPA